MLVFPSSENSLHFTYNGTNGVHHDSINTEKILVRYITKKKNMTTHNVFLCKFVSQVLLFFAVEQTQVLSASDLV